MARIARRDFNASFFHVIVQGINREYIFNRKKDIERYLKLLKQYESEDIQLIAYCIMNNHAHMLLYTKKIENLSKYMHKINSIYAKYYNQENEGRVGYVFKGRYLSQAIENERYFFKCINYIHRNPVKAHIVEKCENYEYSSYQDYINKVGCANKSIWKNIFQNNNSIQILRRYDGNINLFIDTVYDKEEMINDEIVEFLSRRQIKLYEMLQKKEECEEAIRNIKRNQKITYKDIMKKFNINKNKLAKILYK